MTKFTIEPVGFVKCSRSEIEDDDWDSVEVRIELDAKRYSEGALEGLLEFSHIEVIFYLHRVRAEKIEIEARHPRNNLAWPKVGIFAQRGKNRPNQIGSTICRLKGVRGTVLYLSGLDAIDMTPVLDIKPWVNEFGPRGNVFQPRWISELMERYWS